MEKAEGKATWCGATNAHECAGEHSQWWKSALAWCNLGGDHRVYCTEVGFKTGVLVPSGLG